MTAAKFSHRKRRTTLNQFRKPLRKTELHFFPRKLSHKTADFLSKQVSARPQGKSNHKSNQMFLPPLPPTWQVLLTNLPGSWCYTFSGIIHRKYMYFKVSSFSLRFAYISARESCSIPFCSSTSDGFLRCLGFGLSQFPTLISINLGEKLFTRFPAFCTFPSVFSQTPSSGKQSQIPN